MRLNLDQRTRDGKEVLRAAGQIVDDAGLETCLTSRREILRDRADSRVPIAVERPFVSFLAPKKAIANKNPPAATQKGEEPTEPLSPRQMARAIQRDRRVKTVPAL